MSDNWFKNAINSVGNFLTGDFASGIAGLFGTGYNMYTNQRDYDYQRALQKHMEEREDTAIQRRKADLEAAGFNPALAMGQAAGAGPVVSRSNTNDINTGAYLDYMNAANQIKGQKIINQTNDYIKQQEKYNADVAYYNAILAKHKAISELGLASAAYYENGKIHLLEPDDMYPEGGHSPASTEIENRDYYKMKELMLKGYQVQNEQYRVQLEINKANAEMAYKQFQMSEASLNDTVARFCQIMGIENETKRIQNEVNKLNWNKEKWTWEMLADVIIGLAGDIPMI